jgi:hypothetical protein
MIDGFVFRFAECQFGQKTAGSPLGSIVRAVARYIARLPDPVHVASWVDDLIFIMSTPEHGDCAGFVGGCPVCTEYHGRALKVQELWHAKARKLNIPLSAKGHPVGQSGGVHRRRHRLSSQGRFSTLRAGPVEVPSLDSEKELEFDWDMKVRMSERARTALEFMRIAMERYGDAGQPLWPVVHSSLYGAFLAGGATEERILVITFDASVDGCGAVIRSLPDERGTELVGGYRLAAPIPWPVT